MQASLLASNHVSHQHMPQYEEWGLSVNVDKTKIVCFKTNGKPHRDENWTYNGKQVEVVKKFEYLGLNFGNSNSMKRMVKDRVIKAKRAMFMIFANLKKFP